MIGKTLSVTKNVTKANLNEISTKGYDFFWDVARYGYEWLGKDALFYEKENAHDTYGFQKLRYDKDSILSDAYLVRHTPSLDTDPPWLVRKGDLELQQRQISKQTKPKDWKFVPRHRYRPLSIRTLHRQFASLNTESLETEVLMFAKKYGLLGQALWLRVQPRQSLAGVQGEPMHRWRGEIEKMGVLLAIWDLIQSGDYGKLGQVFLWHYNPDYVEVRLKWRYQKGGYEISKWDGKEKVSGFGHHRENVARPRYDPDFFKEYERGYSTGPARYWLGFKLNLHLYGIRPKLTGYHEPEVTHIPITLLDALWLLFMLEVQGKVKTARCKYCGEWFDSERSSKTYCNGNCRRLAFYHREKSKTKGD